MKKGDLIRIVKRVMIPNPEYEHGTTKSKQIGANRVMEYGIFQALFESCQDDGEASVIYLDAHGKIAASDIYYVRVDPGADHIEMLTKLNKTLEVPVYEKE